MMAHEEAKPDGAGRRMKRSQELEIMETQDLPEEVLVRVHRDLDRLHDFLGNNAALVSALRRDPLAVKRVLDVGCGRGGVLQALQKQLNVEVVGVDLRPPEAAVTSFPILRANAAADALPAADVAICTWLAHHLSPDELTAVIRNVGRTCRRFIILDLVRSFMPLLLFNFVAPFLTPVNASDGRLSIRRAYQPDELAAIARRALEGTGATFEHSVTPLRSRQILDIRYRLA